MTFHLSVTLPSAPNPPPPPPPSGGLMALLRRDECVVFDDRYAANGSFSMIGGKGANCWIELGPNEIRFVRSLPDNNDLWNWAATYDKGTIYTFRDDGLGTCRWPVILISSTYTDIQEVRVLDNANGFNLVDAIPYRADGDYSAYTPDKHPEMWLWCWTDFVGGGYGPSHIMPDGRALTFRMPLFDPRTFPHKSVDAAQGLWVDDRLFTTAPANPAIVHEPINLSSPRPITAHLYRIDLSRVSPFVTPVLGYKLTPSQFMERYNMDFAINGDGGPWLFGALVPAGRWMSNGQWLSTLIGENSIWFDRAGGCQFKYSKPTNFDPWNVISGPSHMIQNGAIFQVYDNTLLAGRSAFGLFDAHYAFALVVEGIEKVSGVTEQELAELGMSLRAVQMMEFDSGGSTGVSQRDGVSYSVENRPVLNALCFKIKS